MLIFLSSSFKKEGEAVLATVTEYAVIQPGSSIIHRAEKKENMLIGFSTGCLYKTDLPEEKRIRLIADTGCEAIELGFVNLEDFHSRLDQLFKLTSLNLAPFDYVSFHAPAYQYKRGIATLSILSTLKWIHNNVRPLNLVVFHPDTVEDFSVFRDLPFPIAFENMDVRKKSFKDTRQMQELLDSKTYIHRVVLDVNHAFTNDASFSLINDFWSHFYDEIVEVHLSGCGKNDKHAPLFKTRQESIVKSVRNWKIPIIIESVLDSFELKQELNYVLKTAIHCA